MNSENTKSSLPLHMWVKDVSVAQIVAIMKYFLLISCRSSLNIGFLNILVMIAHIKTVRASIIAVVLPDFNIKY